MQYNLFNRFVRLRNETSDLSADFGGAGEAETESLSSRLDSFLGGSEAPPQPEGATTPSEPSSSGESNDDDDSDFDLFSKLGSKEEPEGTEEKTAVEEAFDESTFDAQTKVLLDSLEQKGHPGDVYKALRNELKELKKAQASNKSVDLDAIPEVATLKAQAQKAQELEQEIEGLRKRNQELVARNDEEYLRETPAFQNEIVKPVQAMVSQIEKIAEDGEVPAEDLMAIFNETNLVKRNSMLDKVESLLGRRVATRIESMVDQFEMIKQKEAAMLQDIAGQVSKARLSEAEAKKQQVEQTRGQYKTAVRESFNEYAKKIPILVDSTGNITPEVEAALQKSVAINPDDLTPNDIGFMAFTASIVPMLRKKIIEMDKEIKSYKGVAINKGGALSGSAKAATSEIDPDDIEANTLAARMRGINFTA